MDEEVVTAHSFISIKSPVFLTTKGICHYVTMVFHEVRIIESLVQHQLFSHRDSFPIGKPLARHIFYLLIFRSDHTNVNPTNY